MLIETLNKPETIKKYIEEDPYVKNGKIGRFLQVIGVVEEYEVEEFDCESLKEFGSIASDFLNVS